MHIFEDFIKFLLFFVHKILTEHLCKTIDLINTLIKAKVVYRIFKSQISMER